MTQKPHNVPKGFIRLVEDSRVRLVCRDLTLISTLVGRIKVTVYVISGVRLQGLLGGQDLGLEPSGNDLISEE